MNDFENITGSRVGGDGGSFGGRWDCGGGTGVRAGLSLGYLQQCPAQRKLVFQIEHLTGHYCTDN